MSALIQCQTDIDKTAKGGRLKRKDSILSEADTMLERWAYWRLRHEESSCLGYPKQTSEGRAYKDGGVLPPAGRKGAKVPIGAITPSGVMCVNMALSIMPEMLRWVILQHYLSTGSKASKAHKFSMRYERHPRDYRDVLDIARTYVSATKDNMEINY